MSGSVRIQHAGLLVIVAVMVSGCAGYVEHRRYTWRSCPVPAQAFLVDVQACVGAAMYTSSPHSSGPPWGRVQYEDCLKGRQYTQVDGKTMPVREDPSRALWAWEVGRWPWPEHPPLSAWLTATSFGSGRAYYDAVCVP